MEGKMNSTEASAKEEVGADFSPGGGVKGDSIMDWELSEKVGEVAFALTAPKILSEVPVEANGMYGGEDLDMESFSFESEDEEESAGDVQGEAKGVAEISMAFDIEFLKAAIEGSTEALDLVVGKDVVMIAGKTGVGKSTLMQGIAGKRIREVDHQTSFSGETASKKVYEAEDALPAFEIGHSKKSHTKSINALIRGKDDAEIVYLDSPGFEDTSGIEMDIATSALLSQVAKRCKSLRFVILIHCASLIEDRGGAFRNILKFARQFVGEDFNESKTSFMFLFTHTGEITGMSMSLSHARTRLQDEIIRTAEGTRDEDVLMVLNFIRKSLNKGYPFVQVLDPMEIDFPKLTSFIEITLKKVTDLTLASACNLTLSSKLKLEGATQNLVQRLKLALRESSQDPKQVKNIQEMLNFLKNYIDVECVRHAADDSTAIVNEHIAILKSSISNQVDRGTNSDLEFTQDHIQSLKEALLQLQELDASRAPTHYLQIIERSLLKFQGETLEKARSLEPFYNELRKISIWADGFEDFAPFYGSLCMEINKYVQGLSTAMAKVSSIDTVSHEEIGIFIFQLYKLHAMCEQLTQFPSDDIDMKSAVTAKDSAMQTLTSAFKSWSLDAAKFAKVSNFVGYEDDLEVIASHVGTVEYIQRFTQATLKDHNRHFSCFEEHTMITKKRVEDDIIGRFNLCCSELKGRVFDPSWQPQLLGMQAACNRFSDMQSISWKQMQSSFFSVIDMAKSALYKASGELDNMAHMVKEHGMISGENLAKEVMSLESCRWFDDFVPPDQKCLAKCCDRVRSIIDTCIQKKSTELSRIIEKLSGSGPMSSKFIKDIGMMLPELHEMDMYSALTNSVQKTEPESPMKLSSLTETCVAHLTSYVSDLSNLANKCIHHWTSHTTKGRIGYMRSMTRKLDSILSDIEALLTARASDMVTQKCNEIRAALHDEFARFKKAVNDEFATFGGNFGEKAAFLVSIKACKGLPHVESLLVDYKKAQHHARNLVSKEATKIEASIGSSSDWDQIDNYLEKFSAAAVLDPFVSGEVSTRLHTLQRLREQKEDQVDDLMQGMIRDLNFKGIGEYLSPLSKSKDQVKKTKFKMHQNEISSSLEEIVNELHRLLDTGAALGGNLKCIAEKMNILATAKSEIQHLLASRLNLAYEIPKLKRQINSLLCRFTKEITEAMKKKDFVQMLSSRRQGSLFVSIMRHYLIANDVTMFETMRDKTKGEVESIPQYVDKFFNSRFEDCDDLFKALDSLKHAKEIGSFPKLSEQYETTKKNIASKASDTMKLVRTVVAESQCYDDMITYVHCLHRQLQGALKEHCSRNLVSECTKLIEDLRQQKKENDCDLDSGDLAQNLEHLSQRLNRLSSTNRWSWYWSEHNATYTWLQNALLEKVESRVNQAHVALKARDLVTVQECIVFLEAVHQKAEKHVKVAGSRARDIRDKCINAFLKLCDQATQILGSNDILSFKEIFTDYRGFIIKLPCVLDSRKGQEGFLLVNQLLYETLHQAVFSLKQLACTEAFDSSQLRSQVLFTRSWGNFLADRLTLLHEEVNIEPDKWLGNIHNLCWEHFNHGRDLSKIKYCTVLGVLPSATELDINKAFKEKAKRYHPDKNQSQDSTMFRNMQDAREQLLAMRHLVVASEKQPFDEILIAVGEKLRELARRFMIEQRYDMAEKLLFELPNVKVLDDLVSPKPKSDEVVSSVYSIVKGYIEKVRVEVNSYWSARKYKDLNSTIQDLKEMERHFKAYPQIFPKSWDSGICSDIEAEIESLGKKASACLQSHAIAKQKKGDFMRCFIQMGFVLVELPAFNAFTKNVMSYVLERCLDSGWGYSYLFEVGLSLQKGDDSSDDNENRVAQMIVTEFNHFKEVLVMVWNEEVLQKPAEDVVMDIKGKHYVSPTLANTIDVDNVQLLGSFSSYERQYKSLLGDYIKPEADLKVLVHKTISLAKQIMPSNNDNDWGEELTQKIPTLCASVFCLFTVLKSGASYNRIEAAAGSSQLGEKLLMKPHNIQVLTLLFLLGCGKCGSDTSLESLMMQIRTGEGKSMILGAAAAVFALLGFRVRTVCYSEYLSTRDYDLFKEVFDYFGITEYIKYSKISTYAEDETAAKGDIRNLTESLLRGSSLSAAQSNAPRRLDKKSPLLSPQDIMSSAIDEERSNSHHQNENGDSVIDENNHTGDGTGMASSPPSGSDSTRTRNDLLGNHSDNGALAPPGGGLGWFWPTQSRNSHEATGLSIPSKHQPDNVSTALTPKKSTSVTLSPDERKEILLVDEVDVFFGREFYGQTYNQVVEFRETEIAEILKRIWNAWSQGRRRLKLRDIKSMPEYQRLLKKLSSFSFLVDNEISLMLDQVSKVDDVPYYLDTDNDKIGYKVMDSISYDATYGYATCFAYLKEHHKLKDKGTLSKVLAIPVSCGQFSFANINPHRIIGVSGTLEALGEYERGVLLKYGLSKYIHVPSVYGSSNFDFDKAGDGIYFENNKSDYFHRISAEITASTKSNRAVIVFFRDRTTLDEFVASPTYRQLSRHKKLLKENMSMADKAFVIKKAATAGQVTTSTAVFGRGTDFFCKDEVVESNGGVHVIQTFLSEDLSEEIQIQGRTARQGKKGSYQLVILESDLEQFGVPTGEKDKIPKKDLYDWLCSARLLMHTKQCKVMDDNLSDATEKDNATHTYFDRLLACNTEEAKKEFENLYHLIKKPPMPSEVVLDLAFAIDITGSMTPYMTSIASTLESLVSGNNSILEKLKSTFPEIVFKLKVGCLGFRDIDDKHNQFQDNMWRDGGHFTDNYANALQCIESMCKTSLGGADIAEDHIGAIYHCAKSWNHANDWTSDIKCLMLLSDAPSHGLVAPLFSSASNYDRYPTRHPDGLTLDDAISSLLSKDIDLFFCSFNPHATARTEDELSQCMKKHPDNKSERGITSIPMVQKGQLQTTGSSSKHHIIFVLDESSSMNNSWSGVVDAYRKYIERRQQSQCDSDLVSVVQFDNVSRITVDRKPLSESAKQLRQNRGGTKFHPAALDACKLACDTPPSHIPAIIFMSDGCANDAQAAAREFSLLNNQVSQNSGEDLELHVIAFGGGTNTQQLQQIAGASKVGKVHASANTADLASVFVSIATNQNVATLLESEIAKRISQAVSDKLSLEYFGS